MMTVRATWRDAACRHADPELFFPVGTAGPALRQIDEAKRICRACPAREACLAWALEHGVAAGVWGGTTENERRALRTNHIRCKRQHAGNAAQTPQQTHGRNRREVPPPAIPGTFSAPLQSSAARIRAASSGTNQKKG